MSNQINSSDLCSYHRTSGNIMGSQHAALEQEKHVELRHNGSPSDRRVEMLAVVACSLWTEGPNWKHQLEGASGTSKRSGTRRNAEPHVA